MSANVQVGFSTGKASPVSWLIRKLTGAKVSHAFVIYTSADYACEMILEEDRGGVQIRPLALFEKTNTVIYRVQPKLPLAAALPAAVHFYNYGYAYGALLGGMWMMLGRRLKKKWHNPVHATKTMFCSALVCRLYETIAYPGFPKDRPEDVTPDDLYQIVKDI